MDAEGKEIIVISDRNCNIKDHRNGCTKSIKSIYPEFQFEQQIEEYTRVITEEKDGALHTFRTLIDHLATNHQNYIFKSERTKAMDGGSLPYLCSEENKYKRISK